LADARAIHLDISKVDSITLGARESTRYYIDVWTDMSRIFRYGKGRH
jgi:hypothetical protein